MINNLQFLSVIDCLKTRNSKLEQQLVCQCFINIQKTFFLQFELFFTLYQRLILKLLLIVIETLININEKNICNLGYLLYLSVVLFKEKQIKNKN